MNSSQPAGLAQMLAHPIRWAVLHELGTSDRRVQELVAFVEAPQNLVSYHLGMLRRSGLVGERRSSADARDVYYRVDLGRLRDGLRELGAGLHPALGSTKAAGEARGSVLFLCSANSARSQMAEATLRKRGRGRVTSMSAGTRPMDVHPMALEALERRRIPIRGLRAKHWSEIIETPFDRVVSLCDIAREELPEPLTGSNHVHWSLPDPAAVGGPQSRRRAAFEAAADEIERRIEDLLPSLASAPAA